MPITIDLIFVLCLPCQSQHFVAVRRRCTIVSTILSDEISDLVLTWQSCKITTRLVTKAYSFSEYGFRFRLGSYSVTVLRPGTKLRWNIVANPFPRVEVAYLRLLKPLPAAEYRRYPVR